MFLLLLGFLDFEDFRSEAQFEETMVEMWEPEQTLGWRLRYVT